MSHRGGNGFDSGESPHGTLLYAGSIPARSTLAVASRQTSLEAEAGRHPRPGEGCSDGRKLAKENNESERGLTHS